MLTAGLLVAFLLLLSVYLWKTFFPILSGRAPPGPTGLPIVGNLLSMLSNPPKVLAEWSKLYGRTIGVYLGPRFMVVLHDPDQAKSVLSDENTTGRDQQFLLAHFFKGRGLLLSEGELWKEQRRFALTTLRNLGMGKSWLEDAILAEVAEVIKTFENSPQPFNPRAHLTLSVSNVICAIVFGERFEHTDKKFIRLCNLFGEIVRLASDLFPVNTFSFLKTFPFSPFKRRWEEFAKNIREVMAFAKALVNEHMARKLWQVPQEETKDDYINEFLKEQAVQVTKYGSKRDFEDDQLLVSVLDLFAAGTETTTSSLLWSFIFMAQYPEVQRKVQAEIDANVGRERPIRVSDKSLLKYTEAALLDIQRLASLVPLSISHTNHAPMKIDGFDIPERSLININTYAIHRDPKFWKKPFELCPEHFLDQEGNIAISKAFLPFGVGKRACTGEALAKMELLLYFANLLQKFRIEEDPAHELPMVENIPADFVRAPPKFNIKFIARN